MKHKKTIFILALVFVLVAALSIGVLAQEAIEPTERPFRVFRRGCLNGEDRTVLREAIKERQEFFGSITEEQREQMRQAFEQARLEASEKLIEDGVITREQLEQMESFRTQRRAYMQRRLGNR